MKFNLTITRTAYENVVLEVEAADQEAAEEKIGAVLDRTQHTTLGDLIGLPGVRYLTTDVNGDEESAWEVLDCEEASA